MQKQHEKLSIGLLLSYFSILAAPLLAIVIIYFTAYHGLLNARRESNQNMLASLASSLDQQLTEVRNVQYYIASDRELSRLTKADTGKLELYDIYRFLGNFPDYKLTNTIIKDVFILLNNQNYIIKAPAIVPSTDIAYQSITDMHTLSYEEVLDKFASDYFHGVLMPIEETDSHNATLGLVQSFPYLSSGAVKGSVIVELNSEILKAPLKAMVEGTGGLGMILDKNNRILCMAEDLECQVDISDFDLEDSWEKVYETRRIAGKTCIIYYENTFPDLNYMVIFPKAAVTAPINQIKFIMIVLSMVSAFTGIFICLYYWKKRQDVILHFCECQERLGQNEETFLERPGNFWYNFRFFLDSVNNLQTTLVLQGNLLSATVIRKLLYAEYGNEEEILADLRSAVLDISAPKYSVAVVDFSRSISERGGGKPDFRLFKKAVLNKYITMPHYYYELDYWSAALILLCSEELKEEELRENMEAVCQSIALEHNILLFMGISDFTEQAIHISDLYEQAESICSYSKRYDLRMLISAGDLPPDSEIFFFPMELEMRFLKAFRNGNLEEFKAVYDEILIENFEKRKLSLTMLNHLTEIIRCLIIRSIKPTAGEAAGTEDSRALILAVTRAASLEEMFSILEESMRKASTLAAQQEDPRLLKTKAFLSETIEAHYGEYSFTIRELSQYCSIPESRLYKDFKQYFGVTFSDYLEGIRINKACEFLVKDCLPVKTVTEKTGYQSDISFRRAFKRVMGVPPTKYVEMHQTINEQT